MSFDHRVQQLLVMVVMFVLAFYLQELPASNVLQTALPEWPFLLTIYFAVSSRFFFGVTSACIVGLLEDAFLAVPTLGLHAAIYVLAAFIVMSISIKFRHYLLVSQALVVAVLVFLKVLLVMIYYAILYALPVHFWALLSVPASLIAWPVILLFFNFFKNRYSE